RDELSAQVDIIRVEGRGRNRTLHLTQEFFPLDRLDQVAERSALRGLHRFRNRSMRGQDDDGQERPTTLEFFQEDDAVHVLEAQIGDHQVWTVAYPGIERSLRAVDALNFVVAGA